MGSASEIMRDAVQEDPNGFDVEVSFFGQRIVPALSEYHQSRASNPTMDCPCARRCDEAPCYNSHERRNAYPFQLPQDFLSMGHLAASKMESSQDLSEVHAISAPFPSLP